MVAQLESSVPGPEFSPSVSLGGFVIVVGVVVALIGLTGWWVFLGRKRLIQDIPTSAARAVTLGLNEVVGVVECDHPEPSPEAGVECAWWKHEYFVADGDGWSKSGEKVGGPVSFRVVDDSGSIEVRARKAEVEGPVAYKGPRSTTSLFGPDPDPTLASRYMACRTAGSTKTRVVETTVPVGSTVYVLGTAQLPYESVQPFIGPDRDGREPFLLRVGSEADAVYRERVGTIVGFLMTLAGAIGAGVGWRNGAELEAGTFEWAIVDPVGPVLGAVATFVVTGVLSLVFVYNGLIRLRQRAQAAWSLIDVQLRRRHDLIPALIAVVDQHARHESDLQRSLAELRAGVAASLPDRPSDEAVVAIDRSLRASSAGIARLMALVEHHPELTADQSFSRLRAALIDTENRIALARSFYNNSVQVLHDRAGAVPGNLVAWVFELDLAAEFHDEREPLPPESNQPRPVSFPTALRPAALARRLRA